MTEAGRFFIGNQTTCGAPVLDPFHFAVEHGFEAFEFFPDGAQHGRGWSAEDLSAGQRAVIRALAAKHHIRLSVHAALDCDLVTAAGLEKLSHDVVLGLDLGAKVVNVHLVPGDLATLARAALSLVDALAPAGMKLALENTISVGPGHINELFARMQTLDPEAARSIGLCLDIGHANLHPATRNDYLGYADRLAPHVPIVHSHIHENWGDGDKHLTLFTGPAARDPSAVVGLLRRLRQRSFEGAMILEQWPVPPALLIAARDRLRLLQAQLT
jgi:sugar phosphate isomerase/epimerase